MNGTKSTKSSASIRTSRSIYKRLMEPNKKVNVAPRTIDMQSLDPLHFVHFVHLTASLTSIQKIQKQLMVTKTGTV